MRIVYQGMFDEVTVPYVEDGLLKEVRAARGVAVDAPDELAASLLEQEDNWAKAPEVGGRKTQPVAAGE